MCSSDLDGDLETSGCLFVGNRGWSGGAVASQYNWIDYGSTFIGNRAMRGYGGAAYVDKIVQLHGTVFQQNTAALGGGALWYGAANNWIHDLGVITLDRVIATGNVAEGGSGGAVYGYDTGRDYETVVSSSVFKNNRALVDGGAIFDAEDATLTVTGSTFQQNRAGLRGIAVMGGSDGGAIMARFVSVVGNRFIGNIALDYGGAICSVNDVYTPDANVYRGNRDGAGYPNWY